MTEKKQRRSDTPGFRWIFCNTCGTTATAGAILFVSGCGHIHCSNCLNALAAKGEQLAVHLYSSITA
uniref:Zinc finger C3HC4 RING-type domain-containing protein n=1 Tax=Parascaris equorum TaxID=6256 RepID=A0A914S1L5_PAREQ